MTDVKQRTRRLTETAAMLALLICLQWAGSQIPDLTTKQLISGSLVNCVLAVTTLMVGLPGGLTLALLSPVFAFLLGIAPNFITVVPIMVGNSLYVILLWLFLGKERKPLWKQPVALVTAATVKFLVLYLLVVQVVCGVASGALLGKKLGSIVVLAPPMLQMLPAMFSWLQLVTALIGGALALAMVNVLKKALHR